MKVNEVWTAKPMTASGAVTLPGGKIGGFICSSSTSGTITITSGTVSGGSSILASTPVTAGEFLELGLYCPDGAYVAISNCTGTFQI